MVGWIRISLGKEIGLVPGDIVLDGDPAAPTERGTVVPHFRPMSIVAKRSSISATAELLLVFCVRISKQGSYFVFRWDPDPPTGRRDTTSEERCWTLKILA